MWLLLGSFLFKLRRWMQALWMWGSFWELRLKTSSPPVWANSDPIAPTSSGKSELNRFFHLSSPCYSLLALNIFFSAFCLSLSLCFFHHRRSIMKHTFFPPPLCLQFHTLGFMYFTWHHGTANTSSAVAACSFHGAGGKTERILFFAPVSFSVYYLRLWF